MSEVQSAKDARKLFSLPSQKEVNYSPAGQQGNKACSSCRFFTRSGWDGVPQCYLIDNWPEPIEPNGLCDRHEFAQPPQIEEIVPVPVVIVEPPISLEDSAEMSLPVPKNLVERVKAFVDGLRPPKEQPVFSVFKAANGKKAWVARFSGKWIDRQDEIIADKAHDEYVERVQKGVVGMPELWMWHAKGTRHGEAVAVWKSGGFVCAAGYFDDSPAGHKAYDYYQKHAGKIKLSHMFHYPLDSKVGNVYYDYNTIEITTLPDGAEAFPYTSFTEVQSMSIPDVAQSMISEALGADTLQNALAMDKQGEKDSKALDAAGVASKGHDKYDGSQTVAVTKQLEALETRLKAAEAVLTENAALKAKIEALESTVKAITATSEDQTKSLNAALQANNDLQKKLTEYTEVKAPASQSNDTILSDKDKSLVDQLMNAAKQQAQKSLVDQAVDGHPVVGSD